MGNQPSSPPRHSRHHQPSPLPLLLDIVSFFIPKHRQKGHGNRRSPPGSSSGSWQRKRRSGDAREYQHGHMHADRNRHSRYDRRSQHYGYDDRDSYGHQAHNRHSRQSSDFHGASVRPKARPVFNRTDSGYSGYSAKSRHSGYSNRSGRSARNSLPHADRQYRHGHEKVQRWL